MFAANALVTAGAVRVTAGVVVLIAQWLRLSPADVGAPIDAALLAVVALVLMPAGFIEIALGLQARHRHSYLVVVTGGALGVLATASIALSALGLASIALAVALVVADVVAIVAAIASRRASPSPSRYDPAGAASAILLAVGAGSLGGSLVFANEGAVAQLVQTPSGRPLGNGAAILLIAGVLFAFGAIEAFVGARRPPSRTWLLGGAGLAVIAGSGAWAASGRPGIEAWVALIGGIVVAVLAAAQREWPADQQG